ncbi:uncharacterized protein FIBRA_00584 [Fibroporia radiculosa]|uniref:E3 ubiquitin-protein ligase RNF220 middle domain-containing protein n=1 Tax=Fibroporia radiculosa TaxID=599839 RepID=J4G0G2_9APHY|nr:uncharacterized protein FIBRA_00584 [Fibroporia radiculosa]CCL98583.1 predicted protein [Fibroporia radiculosa]
MCRVLTGRYREKRGRINRPSTQLMFWQNVCLQGGVSHPCWDEGKQGDVEVGLLSWSPPQLPESGGLPQHVMRDALTSADVRRPPPVPSKASRRNPPRPVPDALSQGRRINRKSQNTHPATPLSPMALSRAASRQEAEQHGFARGKKRALEAMPSEARPSDVSASTTSSRRSPSPSPTSVQAPLKKQKRAETRTCPVCGEAIPVRLLAKHSDLEMARVEEIMKQVGSVEVLADAEPDDGLTSRSRRSSRRGSGLSQSNTSFASSSKVTVEHIAKTIRTLRSHRKQRHARLRELTREEDDGPEWWGSRGEVRNGTTCPVCGKVVPGDVDVVEAHVDSCLAHAKITEGQQQRGAGRCPQTDDDLDVDVEGDMIESVTAGVSFRGTGFDIRDRSQRDIDDDVDIDGEDDAVFGAAQFSETDVIPLATESREQDAEADDVNGDATGTPDGHTHEPKVNGDDATSLSSLVAEGKVVRRRVSTVEDVKRTMDEVMGVGETEEVERTVQKARRYGDKAALIDALEAKISLLSPPFRQGVGILAVVNAGFVA